MTKTVNEDAESYLSSPLFVTRLLLPIEIEKETIENFSFCLGDMSLSASYFKKKTHGTESWIVEWLIDFTPDMKEMNNLINIGLLENGLTDTMLSDENLTLEKVAVGTDWLKECYQPFEPFEVDEFFIYGSNYTKEISSNLTGLQIDAATAFGSGEHGTTKGCLMALEKLVKTDFNPRNILDMGAGSGILGIAAYKRYNVPTLAVDNDRESVRVAAIHRDLNNIPSNDMESVYGDGYNCDEVKDTKSFDLIYANILAAPLREMAPDLAKYLSQDGYAILSGMLEEQANDVLKSHTDQGLELVDRIDIDGWSTLTIKRT